MNDFIAAESERVAGEILRFTQSNDPKQGSNVIFTTPGAGVAISRAVKIPEFPLVSSVGGFAICYIHGSPDWYVGSMMPGQK